MDVVDMIYNIVPDNMKITDITGIKERYVVGSIIEGKFIEFEVPRNSDELNIKSIIDASISKVCVSIGNVVSSKELACTLSN